MRPLRLGLTGGLASGKSTVARWLAEAGWKVVDADELVARLYRPDEPGARAVRELFGEEFLGDGGAVDASRLAGKVFSDPDSLRQLEAAVHPLVRERFREVAEAHRGVPGVVLEATLLVEAGFAPDFDLVVSVEADPEVRVRRAVERGLTEEEARRRLAAQDDARRRAAADRILHNDGPLADLRAQLDALLADLARRPPARD